MDECEEKNERWIEKSNEYTIHKCYTRQFHWFAVGIVFWWSYFLLYKCSTPIQFGKILFHICYGLLFHLPAFIWALKLKCVHWLQWDTFKICFRCAEYIRVQVSLPLDAPKNEHCTPASKSSLFQSQFMAGNC